MLMKIQYLGNFKPGPHIWGNECYNDIWERPDYDTLLLKLSLGMFYSKLAPWVEAFGFDRIHIVDGTNLGRKTTNYKNKLGSRMKKRQLFQAKFSAR